MKSPFLFLYNDWCKNWGKCSRQNLIPLIDAASDFGIKYFVIDAGWLEPSYEHKKIFEVKKDFFPQGIEEIVSYIKQKGMSPGIWFEFEGADYEVLSKVMPDNLLKRDGIVIENMERAFLDFRDPEVITKLKEQVAYFLKEKGFEYIKVDYNENIGIGCDGAESLGEGLRQNMLCVQEFFRTIKAINPQLVIEICSSGGMRTEPSMIALGDQVSFSDIHETEEGAVIAANMHRVLQPSRSQIWATLRQDDDIDRLVNTISKAFLGRLCFSGDIELLDSLKKQYVKKAVSLYEKCVPIIKDGETFYLTKTVKSIRHLKGYQAVLRQNQNANIAMLVINTFDNNHQQIIIESKLLDNYKIIDSLLSPEISAEVNKGSMIIKGMKKYNGAVLLLQGENK